MFLNHQAAKAAEYAAEALPLWTGRFENLIKAHGGELWSVGDSVRCGLASRVSCGYTAQH